MSLNATKKWIGYVFEESIRILSMRMVLAPAAFSLPRAWALGIADAMSLSLVILPRPGHATYWQMRKAFGKSRLESLKLTWGYLARLFRDYVVLKRILYKRENPFDWKIVEINTKGINSLRDSGESYIIAGGHFLREAQLSVFSPKITYAHPVQVGNAPPKKIRSLYDLRLRIQYGTFLKATSFCWGRDFEQVFVGSDLRSARTLYNRLCKRGHVVSIGVDAPWHKATTGSYERPFAGHKSRVFATGAAQLARETKCPVISCVVKMERDGTVVLEWGEPIRTFYNESDKDIKVMDELIDKLEIAIGEKPTQYVLGIGGDRRWNSKKRRWEDLTD